MLKRYKNLLPILFLLGQCTLTAVQVLTTNTYFVGETIGLLHYCLAWILVLTTLVLFFKKRPYFKYAVIITLVSGLCGISRCTSYSIETYIGLLKVEPISLCLCIVYLILNIPQMMRKGEKNLDHRKINEEQISDLKERYTNRSSEELLALSENSRYRADARLAAREILAERKTSQ